MPFFLIVANGVYMYLLIVINLLGDPTYNVIMFVRRVNFQINIPRIRRLSGPAPEAKWAKRAGIVRPARGGLMPVSWVGS